MSDKYGPRPPSPSLAVHNLDDGDRQTILETVDVREGGDHIFQINVVSPEGQTILEKVGERGPYLSEKSGPPSKSGGRRQTDLSIQS